MPDSLLSNMVMKESHHVRLDDPDVDVSVETRSLDSNVTTEVAAHVSLDDPNVNSQYQYSITETQESEPEAPDSQYSSGETQESELESPAFNASTVEEEEEEEEEEEDLKLGDLVLNTPSLDWVVVPEESDRVICSKGSPPRLTFRERGAILRACSVDLNSHEENSVLSTSPQHFRASSDGVKSQEGSQEFKGNKDIFSFHSSFNSALLEGKKVSIIKLQEQYASLFLLFFFS